MKRTSSKLVAAAVAAVLCGQAANVLATELSGRVTEATSGRPLPNATVTIPSLDRTVRSDRSGFFRFTDLPAGNYDVQVRFVGFADTTSQVTIGSSGVASQNFALAGSDIEEVTVTGFRLAQATALQDKKSSKLIKESVTANDAGKLPDQNAGETLNRVVGVSTTTDQGEGRYVTIRGIDAALSNVTIDGQLIGSPEGDTRRVAMDTIPANVLSKLEVIKAATPDLDGNAIGGTVNLVTPSAFDDPDGQFFSATADVGYYDLGGQNPWGASAAFGKVFADDRWGILLNASYSDREFNSENVQGGDPWVLEPDEDDNPGYLIPDEMGLRDYLIRRVRKGVVANLEFRPTDDVKLHWRNIYNRYEDTELQPEIVYDYRNGDLIDQTPTSGTFEEGEGERINTRRYEVQSILSSTLGGEFVTGDWTLSGSLTYGKSEQDTPSDNAYTFESTEELPMSYDTSDRFWYVTAPDAFYDPDNFEFSEAARGHQLIEEDLRIAQADAKRDFVWNERTGYLKFGAKYVSRESTSDQDMTVYDGWDGEDDLLLTPFAATGNPSFYNSVRSGRYTFGPYPDYNLFDQFFRDNEGQFEVSDADTAIESWGVDYRVKEDVTAGYVMGSLDFGNLNLTGGVRVEQTDTDFDAYDVSIIDGDVEVPPPQVTGEKKYTNWLPDLIMTWRAQEDLIVRAAWTNTIGRPSYEQNVPFRVFETEIDDDESEPIIYEGSIEMGNSDLKALESMNWDAAIEWYLEPAGILSAGVFYKDIDNPIYTRVELLEDADFEGRFYSELEIVQPQNAESGNIFGIELAYQKQFTNLPSFWRGFGVSLSYTYTDSESTVTSVEGEDVLSRDVPFFLQSKNVANASIYYELNGFELRLAYAYRSEYLDSVGNTAAEDLYVDEHGQLDFKASYQFTQEIGAFFQMQNITDEPLRYFSGDRSRMAENETYGWNILAGVSLRF